MKEFLQSLLSRKLLLAVAALLTCIANDQWPEAAAVVIGYFGANAYEKSL